MSIRKLPDGSFEADSSAEMREFLATEPERDLRSVQFESGKPTERTGFITPLFCFLPIKSRNWILTPLACFYRPSNRK